MPILTNSRQEKSARLLAGAKTHIDICSGVRRRLPTRHQRQRSTRDRACRSCVNLPYGLLVRTARFNTCSAPLAESGAGGRLQSAGLSVVEDPVLGRHHVDHALRDCLGHPALGKPGLICLVRDLLETCG
jgi:hypothetical protein